MTLIESSKRLANLSPEKRRLLLKMLQKEAERTEGDRSIPRRAGDGPAPLSFSQQRLWFLDRLTPGSPAYNLFSAVRLSGPLRVEALQLALDEIVRRHEVLRVHFAAAGEQPVQVVAPAFALALPMVDLGVAGDEAVVSLALEEAARPFDLSRGPLLRATLLRQAAHEHVLLFTMHHAVSDGWSIGVLIREVGVLYEAFAAGRPSPLPELPLQFPDYAVWQRDWLRGEVLEKQLDYWRGKLAGAPAVLELPTDRPRPPVQSSEGATRLRALGSFLPGALEGLTGGGESTLFMVLLAAFQLLLGRYSRQDDIVVGSPIANRTRPGLESLIGFFANTLVLRTRLDGSVNFTELLACARETTLGAYEHQDLPFERLADELELERSLSHTPLFQVSLVLQNAPAAEAVRPGGVAMSVMQLDTRTAKFDLTLTVVDQGTGWLMGVEHRTDLFDGSTIERLMGHFETLLAGAAAAPQASIWELPLLDEPERRQLLEWGGAVESYPLSGSLHSRFEAWAQRTPDAVAVTFGDESLCYGELDRRANRLAHRLLDSGVKPGSRVCLAVERGFGLVEGILGILKAGCAYVPLDPSYPQERLAWIQEDAGAAAVVDERALTPDPSPATPPALAGRGAPPPSHLDFPPLPGRVGGGAGEGGQGGEGPDWPAYVIYTSGSTGRPKGVVVTHGNVLRLMASTEEWFGFGREDVWTLFHSFAFDFSVWELWGSLLYGGRLVVVPYLVSRSPEAMLELLDREGVTVLNQTPSAFQALQQVAGEGGQSVRWVVFGGEALEPRSLESWWRTHDTGLINMYGITETTVHVTYRRLGEEEILGGGGSVIGVPLRDLSIHVLDAWGNPAPIGVAGEMYVGGAGVALGYLNRPELTAERFVPDHFGARLYRSGDLGRWRASGELEYLGRIDHQVKVRGFRIELGEIESVLLQKPGVEAAVVLVREDTPGDKRLVAYVVGAAEGLRAWVKERLPEYMVPAAFVALEALPLTPNGKVDRKALPAPAAERSESGYVAPRTEEEEVLAAVWAQVLGLDRVGVEDNFFALGGDSILSLRVVALAGERGLAVALPDLFQHQTIAELASVIRETSSEAVRSEPFSLVAAEDRARLPEDLEDAYPLATLQAGMLYHMELTPEDPLYHNVDSWQVKGCFKKELFEEAVRRVVARHPILRTSFAMTGYSEPLQLVHRHAVLPLTIEDIRHRADQDAVIDRLVAREKIDRFDLTKAPQLRFHVFLRSDETYQFTLAENHAIFDGWSLHSTLAEIFELYYELLSGNAAEPLPPLELTYREFIRLEREALTSAETQAYWHRLLEEAEPVEMPRWPEEYRRPGARRVAAVEVAISPELTAGLKRAAREAAVPLKSVLLAAHCKVLSLLAGRPDVITGVVSNGRLEENEGDQVRGLFLNTLPLRLRVPEGWRELIRTVFQAEQEMLPHRRYPFGALQRQWGERPLYEIAFNFIRFHVVRDLMRSGHFEILGFKKAEGGNFKLQAHFGLDLEQQGIGLELEYDSHEVADVQVREIAEVYLRTLTAISEDRSEPVLPPASRHRLLWEWNDTAIEYAGAERCLHELVEEQVERTPDRLAVEIEGQSLTYRELSKRTNRLARHLQRLGVEPEMPVGIYAERSLELVVGLLGILKAGGAYVPLDPEYPQERLAYMIEDSGARVVLSPQDLRGNWEEGEPEARVSPDNLAYVIYTSGSTGKPKGVMNTHRGIANRLLWIQSALGMDGSDVLLQKTPASFDVSVGELFWPLVTGATLSLARPGGHRDASYLVERIVEAGVTTIHFVPSMLRAFLETPGLERCRSLRRVMTSGEALTPDLVERFFSHFSCELHNLYGPTEAAVEVTHWPCTGEGESVPIGRPIGNTRIHLLDGALEPVAVGVAGELYIGGVNLARGYAGRPDLTAERFIASPVGFGERLYRTGDLARYRPDGAIEYLGRVDHQVKVRGFRIELGEIEAALGQHPGVAQAVVVVIEDRLVAYLVGEAVASELRAFLLKTLPEYMAPAVYVALPAFPLTPSGKVDRRALPAPTGPDVTDGYVAPSDPTEQLLAGIWAEVLGVKRVGVRDDFFALGGHSLLATQVMSRIRAVLGVELPLRRVFEARTLVELAQAVRESQAGSQAPPIVPVPRDEDLPLSFAQQRLWLIDQLEPDSPAYNIPLAVRLTGEVEPPLLERVFAEVVRRHEALRTTFSSHEGRPVQVIASEQIPELPVVDLSLVPEEQAFQRAVEEARRPFDLQRGPLLRLSLIRLGERDHILLVTMHHIVSDGWSLGVLLREIAALHAGRELPDLPVQYADFAVWQRQWLQGEVLESQLSFWKSRLAAAPTLLELPIDRPRPAVQTSRGASRPAALPSSEALRDLCRREGVTPFMALLAAWSVLLGRHAGQDDVLVGTPIAGRNRREVEDLIGFFVNTLVMRADLSGAPSFRELLGRVRKTALDAYAHQDVPFERLVEELVPERDLAHAPLFQVMFALQNAPMGSLSIPGLTLTPLAADSGTTKFDLTLSLQEVQDGFAGALEYNTDLFDGSTAARLLARFETLLAAAVADPSRALSELPLLPPAERQQALLEWNDRWSGYPRESSVPELFEAVARSFPEAPAILSDGEVWSYRRLDEASNRLARRLRPLGIGAAVGVSMERSPELVVAILAILKAGGVYVPLDADYPDERLAFMLADTGAEAVLVHPRTRERLEGRARLIPVEESSLEEGDGSSLGVEVPSGSLAYVIYTSGSTGRPKGVAVPHRAIARLVRETDYVQLGPGDRVAFLSNISFDAATFDLWGALLNGAAVVPIPRDVVLSPAAFAAHLRRDGVTALFLTTALFNQVVREVPDAFAAVRYVLFGGEASDPASVGRALALGAPERLLHVYGPTESTTFATWHPVLEVAPGTASLPIGRPLANTTAYVLDRSHAAVPPGAAGELCLGGDGLAQGYLNRPELTAERFIPHPWSPGERLYRTGDLVRLLPDGAVDFLGRLDDQVKIRGFRIEPGEIEAMLAATPEVRACAVLARRDSPGETRLVAYVVYREGVEARSAELRSRLRERLPDYMVPSVFVTLEALPLTPNGKLDRRALPVPEPERPEGDSFEVPADPADPISELLGAIWAEVLGLDRIGRDQDFFALGGHSLLATRVVSRVRAVLGVELPLRALFEAPTISSLADAVRDARSAGAAEAPPIVPVPRDAAEDGLPLSFSQQRLWFLDQLEPGSSVYNVPLALRLTGELRTGLLERAFTEVVRRHEALRTTFSSRDGRPVQVIAPALRLEPPVIDLSGLAERELRARRLAAAEARRPFDLERGPLLRLALVRLDEREHVLLLTLHHIVSDGWSMGVLLREIAALYGGRSLPELPVQYADFAVWQRRWLDLEGQLAYWRRQLDGAPRVLELPADRPRPAMQTFRGAALPMSVPPALSERVRELCRRAGATPFMALLAAWSALLGRHADQRDVLVGTPIAGRNRREIEGLIGFFVNTLVMRADLSGAPGFVGLLERVRQTALDAYTHQDLPFDRLVEELVPERDLSTAPLFQVMLTMQNASRQTVELPGLALSPLNVDSGMEKFDLTLALQEGAEGFAGVLGYNTDLFDGSTAARLAARFQALLEAAVADPGLSLDELPLLLAAERHQVLAEWNDTSAPRPEILLHELVSAQARRTPEAIAASFEGESLSYGELERRANRVAHYLAGVGVEARVGVRMERSLEMIVALLGVLKAGAAYVPLDPTYPAERLALLVESSGAQVVLDRELVLRLDTSLPDTVPAADGNLAYVLYTSGSTGTPKGVMIPHRGIVNRLLWMQETWPLTPGDRVLQKTPFTFDVSLGELFGPLLCGARLVFARPEGHKDPVYLADLVARERITSLHFVPSMMGAFLEVVEGADLSSVRRVLTSGEALTPELARRFLRIADVELLNLYGPTEASVEVSFWACGAESPVVPIGRPIANLRLHVVDRETRPQPVGVPGELLLGGAGLARGYLGRPDLTAAAFVPDPFSEGERLYRTGDLCRLLADGNVEFLGRIDHQVKVRGFRIELGEIEAVLASHPAVRECVVIAREVLVAYVVGSAEQEELKAFLRRKLPDYMVPAVFVALDALPLTPSGKVDRRALPDPQRPRSTPVEAAADPVEDLLADTWAEVLGLERIGRDEDFFALGGHSLLATQVVSRVRTVLGIELPLRALFESPTVSGLARVVRESRQGLQAPPIVPVPRDGRDLPLSFSQQRLWFLDQLEPGSPAYNIPLAVRLAGELWVELLERIFAGVVRRHESLRTTFDARDGRPVQVIAPALGRELPVIDLSGLPEREARARELATEEARRPFDLQRGPLLRLTLVRLDEREHILLLTMHHIVSDGWSMGVLLREIAALYALQDLPGLPVQYADFAVWQRSWLQGEVLDGQLAYWKRQLDGVPRVLELPTDRPRPAMQTFRGSALPVSVSAALAERLRELCRRAGVTPFMALLAAWSALLGRHADQRDVLVGTPIAGRNRREVEGLIGFFVNTLVMRADLSGAPGYGELLGRVRRAALDAYTHQDLPFDRLVEELVPERDMSTSPLFQVMLTLQNASRETFELPGLVLSPLAPDGGMVKFDLSLALQEGTAGIEGSLLYNTDLFDGSTAARLAARFQALLEAAAADPGLSLDELPLLLAAERHQVLAEWNDTSAPRPEILLHELVSAQARRMPEAVAASFEDESLSYGELERRANRVAHYLAGVGVEARVGVRMERSLEMIVALLGVLKAGAAYVPLDPTYPAERLALLVESSGARVVLDRELVLRLDTSLPDTVPVADGNLAYVLYTSGSTGTPKGVMIPHRGIVNRLLWMQETWPLAPGDRVLQKTPFTFDVSLGELFGPLLCGARLVFARPEGHKDPVYLADLVARERITSLHFVPSMMGAFLEVAEGADLSSIRRVQTSGEALTPELARRFLRIADVELLNLYGPTEASVEVSFWACDAESPVVPIGRPIANLRLHVVDREMRPQPVGVPGELLLGGVGLARGYLGRPDLTAAAFVPDPFGALGERLYRTGDLCRLLADGSVEFLGRIDHQVKMRGFRIELGEIEAVLASHPAVRECVVLARDVLVAYVVVSAEQEALKAFLGRKLPDYMVPSVFVALDTLPLTPSGKVDRRALPAPELSLPRQIEAAADPLDPIAELLAGIWAEVLGVDRVGRDQDFFALGGHSLLATQVVSRVRAVLGVELPLRALFEAPTVSGLARVVRDGGQGPQAPPIVPVPRAAPEDGLPLSFAQQRLWFLDQLEPGSAAYNIPLAVRLTGELSPERLERVFAEVVRRHESLRTTFVSHDGRPVQVIAPPRRPELPVIDLSQVPEQTALLLAREEAQRPFDLAAGPLLRLALVRLGERDHVLLLTLHHIVSDGWSMGVLLREIAALHEGRDLPELAVQYADFAVWQRSWLQGEVLEEQLAYWRRQLGHLNGAPRVLELPLDRPRPVVQTFRGASRSVSLSPLLSEAVHGICRQQGVTPFMALLAAWAVVLGRHAGQEDVVLGTPIAGRNRREIESLIGFFVNTLVLRADLSGSPGFAALLERVRRTALDGYTHQDVPFERLVEELVPERDMSYSPLFQAMFVLQNAASNQGLSLPGLTLAPLAAENEVAKFDLTLTLVERADRVFVGALEHNLDLFDGSTTERLWARFTALLEGALSDPRVPVSELPLLPSAERHQALLEWNDTARGYVSGLCLHDLIARQAESAPDRVAVSFAGQELSCAELDRRAGRLACTLIALGVEPDDRVGVLAERSLEMVIGLLGVLKAGAAYVPLDPLYPAERLALLVDSSGARAVLAQERLAGLLPGRGERIVVLDAPAEGPDRALAAGEARGGEDNLAYVIYTSGSTGTPKGVMVPHRGVVNRLLWGQEVYRLGTDDAVLQKASFSFDISVWELFAPLIAGARLVVAAPEEHRDAAYLVRAIAEHGVTMVDFVPSMLGLFLEEPGLEGCASLRQVFTGGDALSPALRDRFLERLGRSGVLLDNQYGPTETSIDTAHWVCRPGMVAIGRPVANTRLYVTDSRLGAQPPGAAGELLIGGVGLTRGYLGRPDLTAAAFVPDPFGAEPGGRLYRTGDLCRLLPDGSVEFLGRIDHQVKVRGLRIELGEIETVLGRHPDVKEVVVLAREHRQGTALAGYVVMEEDRATTAELRRFLGERLPAYMVPSAFVFLDEMPLTAGGKVDRATLSASAIPEWTREGERTAPRDVLELRLVRLWEELLGLESLGIRDDFFELGGHSLLAVQMAARIQKSFGRSLPIAALLRNPTVERLAAVLREGGEPARGVLVELTPGTGRPFFCVHAVGGEVLSYVLLARQLEVDRPVFGIQAGLQAQGDETVEEMAARYLQAIREVQPEGPYSLGGWSMGGVVAFEMARQLEQQGETVEPVVLIDSHAPGQVEETVAEGELVGLFAHDVARLFGLGLPSLPAAAEDALLLLATEAERTGVLPAGTGNGEVQRRYQVFRANFRALESYSGGPCAAPVILFKAAGTVRPEADLGWSRFAPGPVEVHALPGDHYTLLQPPHVQVLAARLRERLL